MQILVTGGTGLIGYALVNAGLWAGHDITLWARDKAKARKLFGNSVGVITEASQLYELPSIDWVVNLAGEPVATQRWSARRKRQLLASRLRITRSLAAWIETQDNAELVFLSGSALGIYGDQGANTIDEQTPLPAAPDFAANLCMQWEKTALGAHNCRTLLLRTGLVLGNGGLLSQLRPAFRLGLGGRLGGGTQYMPWIHIDDYVRALLHLAEFPAAIGAYNLCAPNPVTNAEFTRSLAQHLRRPAFMHLPAPLVKLLFGELSTLLLGGQNARPTRLLASGFGFRYPHLQDALPVLI